MKEFLTSEIPVNPEMLAEYSDRIDVLLDQHNVQRSCYVDAYKKRTGRFNNPDELSWGVDGNLTNCHITPLIDEAEPTNMAYGIRVGKVTLADYSGFEDTIMLVFDRSEVKELRVEEFTPEGKEYFERSLSLEDHDRRNYAEYYEMRWCDMLLKGDINAFMEEVFDTLKRSYQNQSQQGLPSIGKYREVSLDKND